MISILRGLRMLDDIPRGDLGGLCFLGNGRLRGLY